MKNTDKFPINEIEDLILTKFHGFSKEQWRDDLSKHFPYNELECLVKMAFVKGYNVGFEKGKLIDTNKEITND